MSETKLAMRWLRSQESILITVGHRTGHRSDTVDMSTDQQWPELLGVLFTLSNSEDAGQRENAYRVFTTTPGIIEKQHEDTVLSAFTKGFKDSEVAVSSSLHCKCQS